MSLKPHRNPAELLAVAFLVGCGGSLPAADLATQPASTYVEVPYPPPPARVEFVPEQPQRSAVWVDGEWTWKGRRWAWQRGRWVVLPDGVRFAPWIATRRRDGTLFHAPGVFVGSNGTETVPPAPLAEGLRTPDEERGPRRDGGQPFGTNRKNRR